MRMYDLGLEMYDHLLMPAGDTAPLQGSALKL